MYGTSFRQADKNLRKSEVVNFVRELSERNPSARPPLAAGGGVSAGSAFWICVSDLVK